MSPKLLVADYLQQSGQELYIPFLEYPADPTMGDVALPCFQFAKELRKSPVQIATDIANAHAHASAFIEKVEAVGPYVNFFLNWSVVSKELFQQIQKISPNPLNPSQPPFIKGGEIQREQEHQRYGEGQFKDEVILVESPGPNTNKPLHLGHVRNMLLGNSVAKILSFNGYEVKKVDIINDRGVHICKSMLAYQTFGNNAQPDCKSDHYVGKWYVKFDFSIQKEINDTIYAYRRNIIPSIETIKKINDCIDELEKEKVEKIKKINYMAINDLGPELEISIETASDSDSCNSFTKVISQFPNERKQLETILEGILNIESKLIFQYEELKELVKKDSTRNKDIQEMLVKREQGDPETIALRKTMNTRCLDGHAETYKRYGTHIDKAYLESDHYLKGKKLVEQGLKDGIFKQNEKGNIVADLTEEMGQEKTVLRADGTSIYITQDLALGKIRYEDFCMNRMIYVVGNEQEDHFKALFHLFKKLGYSFADRCFHLSYGMIELPDGKMKSREGNVVDADWLADEMHTRVVELLQERYPDLDADEVSRRAEIIAMAAIKFFVLKYDAKKNFVFDREHSLDFAGETGPYVLYSYARAKTIIEKSRTVQQTPSALPYPPYQGEKDKLSGNNLEIQNDERILLSMLAKFPETVAQASEEYAPSVIARYVLALAGQFNSYYHHTKILDEGIDLEIRDFRLDLVRSVAEVLKTGLELLGIGVLEKM